jgi:hypothetical protein
MATPQRVDADACAAFALYCRNTIADSVVPRALSQGLEWINCVYDRSASIEAHGKELQDI